MSDMRITEVLDAAKARGEDDARLTARTAAWAMVFFVWRQTGRDKNMWEALETLIAVTETGEFITERLMPMLRLIDKDWGDWLKGKR